MTQYEEIHINSCKVFEQLGITLIEDSYLRYQSHQFDMGKSGYVHYTYLILPWPIPIIHVAKFQNWNFTAKEGTINYLYVDHALWYHVASVGRNDLNSSTTPLSSILNLQCSPHSWGKSEHKFTHKQTPVTLCNHRVQLFTIYCPSWKLQIRLHGLICAKTLTHLPLDKMAAISQTLFSDAFSWMKTFDFD